MICLPRFRRMRRRILFILFVATLLIFFLGRSVSLNSLSQFVPAAAPEEAVFSDDPSIEQDESQAAAQTSQPEKPQPQETQQPEPEESEEQKSQEEQDDKELDDLLSIDVEVEDLFLEELDDPRLDPVNPMSYGTTHRPAMQGLVNLVEELPVELVPATGASGPATKLSEKQPLQRRRLVFVGDVHGQRSALEALLSLIDFDAAEDHLVLTGDMVNKGPDSAGVVQLAMDLGASAVRGNHDDRVLLTYEVAAALRQGAEEAKARTKAKADSPDLLIDRAARLRQQAVIEAEGRREKEQTQKRREQEDRGGSEATSTAAEPTATPTAEGGFFSFFRKAGKGAVDVDQLLDPLAQMPLDHGDDAEREVAATLTPEQYRWLADRPVMLHVGPVAVAGGGALAATSPFQDVVVVHAGLVPGVALADQDPTAVMTMRSLVHPADEARHSLARSVLEHEARVRLAKSRGRHSDDDDGDNNDHIYIADSEVDEEYRKMQQETYGPDLQHPPLDREAARAAGLAATETDLVLMPIPGHASKADTMGPDNCRLPWTAVWNAVQHARPDAANRTTVIYGHDALTGLAIPPEVKTPDRPTGAAEVLARAKATTVTTATPTATPGPLARLFGFGKDAVTHHETGYTFGLDSGCVYGRRLSALIVEAGADGQPQSRVEQVVCMKGRMNRS